jgi:hypothetical protein
MVLPTLGRSEEEESVPSALTPELSHKKNKTKKSVGHLFGTELRQETYDLQTGRPVVPMRI